MFFTDVSTACVGRFRVFPALASPGKWMVCSRASGLMMGDYHNSSQAALLAMFAHERAFSWTEPRYPDRGFHDVQPFAFF